MARPYQARSPETRRLRRLGPQLAASFVVLAAAIWAFAALLEAVLDNATLVSLDVGLAALVREHVSSRGVVFFDAVSNVGSPTTAAWLGIIGAVMLLRRRDWEMFVVWAVAFIGFRPLELVLKAAVHRTRPASAPRYRDIAAFSFPSGHSIAIVVGVPMLLYVVFHYRQPARWVKVMLVVLGGYLIVLVGVSRVYLGAHYPSDVLGGYAAGAAWVATCIGVSTVLKHRAERVSSP